MKKNKYSDLVNFKTNLNEGRHSWFDIKEGYSTNLVTNVIKELDIKPKSGYIFDPFSGSGTTVLQSSIMGFQSFGIEVNPFLHFLSNAKCQNYSKNLDFYRSKFKKLKLDSKVIKNPPKLSISKKLFRNQLKKILSVKNWIFNIPDTNTKNLFLCAFLCSLEKASFAKKDGNGLKYPKNKKPENFNSVFINNLNKIIEDTKRLEITKKPKIFFGSNEHYFKNKEFMKKYKNTVSLCLFSPPYANCFDYSEVYKTELWFGDFVKDYDDIKKIRNLSLSSHLNKNLKKKEVLNEIKLYLNKIKTKKLWSKKILLMLENYFFEMNYVLSKIFNLLKKNGNCVIVVGNSSYGNTAIPTDLILKKLGKKIGFKKTYIIEARKLGTSSQQYKFIDNPKFLRESLVFLKKC